MNNAQRPVLLVVAALLGFGIFAGSRYINHRRPKSRALAAGFSVTTPPSYQWPATRRNSRYLDATLAGKVVDHHGKPVPGVHVLISMNASAYRSLTKRVVDRHEMIHDRAPAELEIQHNNLGVTDANGLYKIPIASHEPYVVMVDNRLSDFVSAAAQASPAAPRAVVTVREMVLEKGAVVTGKVTNAGGPISNCFILVHSPDRPQSDVNLALLVTDPAGRYQVRVSPGQIDITPQNVAGHTISKSIEVKAGDAKTVDFMISEKSPFPTAQK